MSCSGGRRIGHAAKSLEVFFLRHDLLESARDFLCLKVDADFFKLTVVEFSGRLQFLLVAELIDHQPNLITGKFKAHLIEGIFQFFELNETTLFGDLKIEKEKCVSGKFLAEVHEVIRTMHNVGALYLSCHMTQVLFNKEIRNY